VRNKAVYLALGVTPDGRKEVLGLWIESTEGAKFWLRIVNELRNRGITDILIAVVDGLKGFPEAINAAFPQTLVQTCIVHTVRTQSTIERVGGIVALCWRTAQRDDMADLQAALMHDDALDDELQDGLLVSHRSVVKPAADALAECSEVSQHGLRLRLLAT
jgi:hypothetical protein